MEEVARAHGVLESVERLFVALAIRVVHGGEQVGGPGQLEFRDDELEVGIALEDTREDHVAHRHRGVEGLRGAAARVAKGLLPRPTDLALPPRGRVQGEGKVERLRRGPEGLVLRLVVASLLGRVFRDHRPGKAHLGGALQLLDAVGDVVEVDHGDAFEPRRIRAAELGEPLVVGAKDRGQERGIRHLEVEQALRRIQHLARDPVELHVPEVLPGVISSSGDVFETTVGGDGLGRLEPSAGIGNEPDAGHGLLPFHHELIDAIDPLHPGRAIAKGRVDAGRPQIRRLEHVRVGRENERGYHRRLRSCHRCELVRILAGNPHGNPRLSARGSRSAGPPRSRRRARARFADAVESLAGTGWI